MLNVEVVVAEKSLAQVIEKTWEAHEEYYKDKDIPYFGDVFKLGIQVVKFPQNIIKKCANADTIISRGGFALTIKETIKDIPVVEVPITREDILEAIKKAMTHFNPSEIAIVGTDNMLNALTFANHHNLEKIKRYTLPKIVFDEEVIESTMTKVMSEGKKIIVGGGRTKDYCEKKNFPFEHIDTSIEAAWQAISEAKRAASIYNQERRRAMQFRTIVNYAHEGMLALDFEGKVTLLNEKGSQLLGIHPENAVGFEVSQLLHPSKLRDCILSNQDYLNEVITYKDIKIDFNKIALFFEEKQIGTIINFQDVTSIMRTEGIVRKKLHEKGLAAKYTFNDILGQSASIRKSIEMAKIYATVSSNVMLYGQSGTGKELFAQAIHNASDRANQPFVAVNCAALPESLLESELFGYVGGAFTGASKEGKMGLFELAHQGTIFLDEIGELPLQLQGRLLRVLQEKEIRRIGDDRIIPIDARIVCATNKDLWQNVEQGSFREDLYFRLNVLRINIPTLKERPQDIKILTKFFLDEYAKEFGKKQIEIDDEALQAAMVYEWKGNIRELRNVCERLIVYTSKDRISSDDLEQVIFAHEGRTTNAKEHSDSIRELQTQLIDKRKEYEAEQIRQALQKVNYNKTEAARLLGISRTSLWRKMKLFDDLEKAKQMPKEI